MVTSSIPKDLFIRRKKKLTFLKKHLTKKYNFLIIQYKLIIQNIKKYLKDDKKEMKMAKKEKNESCSPRAGKEFGCCKIESVISVDERGQMVLPKEMRQKAGIKAGDKLAIITMEKEGKVCCLSLVRVEDFADMVKGFLGPVMRDIIAE